MTDHSMPRRPDYDLADEIEVTSEVALKALADPTRSTIISLLEERAASIGQLAEALDKPKSSVDHHVKVLESAGLVKVVRTRKVRAITERFYGRTARWFLMTGLKHTSMAPDFAIQQAFASLRVDAALPAAATARYARMSADRAAEYRDELVALIDRFKDEPSEGDTVWAMAIGLFPTDRPYLRPSEAGQS